jgi:thiol:disulfide interchange protein
MSEGWVAYEPYLFAWARDAGKVVVLDFTAEWDINMKALRAQVLVVSPVKEELAREDVVRMVVDLTAEGAPGWKKLEALGEKAIPLLVIYTPGVEMPWRANAYNSKQVVEALEAARKGLGKGR